MIKMEQRKNIIEEGQAILGLELGSTRIKAVLIGKKGEILETGGYNWENQLIDGIWTYQLSEVWSGIQKCYQNLLENVAMTYNVKIKRIKSIGISAMMHGYLPFDKKGEQLAEFRTWRNNITEEAADILTEKLNYNIPQRWSIAHLYQSILNQEKHVEKIDYLTTLSGYVHWMLTGRKVLGIGDASGMFPIDIEKKDFNQEMLCQFDQLIAAKEFNWKLKQILPKILVAGENAGVLTEKGALLLDTSGMLQAGAKMCPPEGDAGTGMVATNSVEKRTGNVSAGTSAFAMVVLERELSKVYRQLDMVTTPEGALVAMAHANNCTTEINTWISIFDECMKAFKMEISKKDLYKTLFEESLKGEEDCGGLLPYCFHSGEHGVGLNEGCPMFLHPTNTKFTLANFMRAQLYTCFGAMKLGMDILMKEEAVKVEKILGHGGIFKTRGVSQKYLAAAMETPVIVMETAGEGGAWGIALLAEYMDYTEETLTDFLNNHIFKNSKSVKIVPDQEIICGYSEFMNRYKEGLEVEKAAVAYMKKI